MLCAPTIVWPRAPSKKEASDFSRIGVELKQQIYFDDPPTDYRVPAFLRFHAVFQQIASEFSGNEDSCHITESIIDTNKKLDEFAHCLVDRFFEDDDERSLLSSDSADSTPSSDPGEWWWNELGQMVTMV